MTDEPPTLASRLDRAFTTLHPADRGPWSYKEVSEGLKALGVTAAPSYIWGLRKGEKDNPSLRQVKGLADFFHVPVSYFVEDDQDASEHDLAMAQAMSTPEVRELVTEVSALPGPIVSALTHLVRSLRSAPAKVVRQRKPRSDEA